MRLPSSSRKAQWLVICPAIVTVLACTVAQATPAPKSVEVTQVVPVTRIVQSTQIVEVEVPVVEVTRIVPVTQTVEVEVVVEIEVPVTVEIPEKTVEVTRLVPATRTVEVPIEVTRLVPATRIVVVEVPVVTRVVVPAEPPAEATPTPVSTLGTPIANDAVLVWYDFEDNFLASGMVTDRSGNGYNAQLKGTVEMVNGLSSGQAIFFSGNGYIQAESNPAAGRNTVSFSLWFKTDHPENNYKLASAAWWSGGPGSGWILATHIPEFWSDDTNSLYLPGQPNDENHFPADEWVHEVVTYDGGRIREYTNGQLVNDWPATGARIGQGQAMVVGGWPLFSGFNYRGNIDEFRLFGWALTPQEVQGIYDRK